MPGIDGAFGTSDITIRTPVRSAVWDWKFGAGKPVYASYRREFIPGPGERAPTEDPGSPDFQVFGNDQLTFYGRACMHTHPDYFEDRPDWPVDLVICQPRIVVKYIQRSL